MLPISVRIFASHPVAVAQYRRVLAAESGIHLALKEKCIDVGVFDVELPCLEPTLTVARLGSPSMRPLLLSCPIGEEECLRWMLRGVRGMVLYDHYEKELPHAIRTLAQGQLYFAPQVISKWKAIDARMRAAALCMPLTRRELEVAGLLSRRLSNKQIGAVLGLTERTVKFHVGNLLAKLGLGSRYELSDISTAVHGAQALAGFEVLALAPRSMAASGDHRV